MSLIFRSLALARGLGSTFLGWFERRNPEVLLDNERENKYWRRHTFQEFSALVTREQVAPDRTQQC